MLETKKLDKLYRLLKEMTQLKASDSKLVPPLLMQGAKYSPIGLLFFFIGATLLGLTEEQRLGTTFPAAWVVVEWFFVILFFISVIPVIGGILYVIWHHKQLLPGMWTSLENALHRDRGFLKRLWEFDKETLAYGLLQYDHRWSSRDDRVAVLAGDLRKIGLYPALAALFISLISAATILLKGSNLSPSILQGFGAVVVLVGAHYLIAFNTFLSRERPQQVIKLLEYAIQHADQCNATPSGATAEAESTDTNSGQP